MYRLIVCKHTDSVAVKIEEAFQLTLRSLSFMSTHLIFGEVLKY